MTKDEWKSGYAGRKYPGREEKRKDDTDMTKKSIAAGDASRDKEEKGEKKSKKAIEERGEDKKKKEKEDKGKGDKGKGEKVKEQKEDKEKGKKEKGKDATEKVGKEKGKEEKEKEQKEDKEKGKKEKAKDVIEKEGKEQKGKETERKQVKGKRDPEKELDYYALEEEPEAVSMVKQKQIARELADKHVEARKSRWPSVTKVTIKTRPWAPPGPPGKPPKIIIKLPTLRLENWIPPFMIRKEPRPKLPRKTPDQITEALPYSKPMLKKAWHGFVQVEPNKMMLQGTIACDSTRYCSTFRGAQTGCVAIVCRALLDEKSPAQLVKQDVDDVIEAAEQYYRRCLKINKCYKGKPALELCQLILGFFFHGNYYNVELAEVERGILTKLPESDAGKGEPEPDLLALMEKRIGQEYMFILTVNKTKHFLIWGHPPEPEVGSQVKTICYIFDPHMLNEYGTRINRCGEGAFLRYPGVTSFVLDFLLNHCNLQPVRRSPALVAANAPITLTTVEILKKEPMPGGPPGYVLDLSAVRTHCRSEWDAYCANAMIDEKLYQRKWALASMSAESVAISRNSSRKKIRTALGVFEVANQPTKSTTRVPPVLPEQPPPATTKDQLMQLKGEDFFLHCPRTDAHTFGRDDRIPYARSETVLHSHYEVAEATYSSQFKQLDAGKWILRGTRHFASQRYQSFKWYTGVACCVAALAALRRYRARTWNEDNIDETFDVGYNLLRDSLMERRGPIRRLVLGELKNTFKMRDKQYKFKKRNIVVWGKLISNNPKVFDLCRGVDTFFKESDTGLLQIPGEFETTIWYEGGKYYMYHPWPADRYGNKVGLQGGGKGCLLAFSSISRLCEHFLENNKDLKRKPYSISDVSVWDLGERPEPVNNMKAVGPNRWIVRGSFHEGDERFPEAHRNKQATPVSIAAIAMAALVDPAEWTEDDINETLIRGDILYEKTMENLDALGINLEQPARTDEEDEGEEEEGGGAGVTGTLAAADVLSRFNISEYDSVETEILDSQFSGVLLPEPGSGVMSLKSSLAALFKDNKAGVVTARGASMAVWKHDDHLYFFDPHGCDENGLPSDEPRSTACLLRMKDNVKELADVIMGNLAPGPDDSFNISPVEIIPSKINRATGAPDIEREGKAFEWLNKHTATILMGPRGENTAIGEAARKCFIPKEDLAGRTLALPVIAAFSAATEAVPPPGMHQEHIFNFLEAGGEYYRHHVKTTGRKEITVHDLSERFEMGVNTFSIEVGAPTELPLRLPDATGGEGGGAEEEMAGGDMLGEEEHEPKETLKEMKELLFKMWYDTTHPTTVSLLCGDYHQLGVWMSAEGKVVAFDPAPTLAKGLLTRQRLTKGDELRNERLKGAEVGEALDEEAGADDEEPGAEGEAQPEPEPEFVPPESCPVLMIFASPGEFIDKLVFKGGLDPKQALAPYSLYPVTVTNELTSLIKDKKPGAGKEDETEDATEEEKTEPQVEPLEDSALGKYFDRKTRTTASLRGCIAQNEPYFMDAPNRDNQDAAISIMGIIVHNIEPYQFWKPTLIDAILKYGDRLYTLSLPRAKNQPRLAPGEVLNEFHVTNFNIRTEVAPVVTGDYKAPETGSLLSLKRGLKKFFETDKYAVICAKNYCAAVWRAMDDKAWVYWDPHPVGPTGKLSPASAAGVVLFSTLDELADTFKTNLANLERPGTNNYSIAAVKVFWEFEETPQPVSLQGSVPDEGYEWKVLTAYVETARGRTILRGSRPLEPPRFIRDALLWSAASAVVAITLANMRRPPLWTAKTVDEIIRNGCSLFNQSLAHLGYEFRPGEDILHPLQLDKDFVLGSNFIRYDLQEVFHGMLDEKTAQEMTAELGLEKFFENYSQGILWSAPYAVALWRVVGAPQFYMMEPHACDPNGLRTNAPEDAAPCVMTFTSSKLMSFAYLQNLPRPERYKHEFTLYAMTVNVAPIKPWKGGEPALVRPPPGAPRGHRVVPATSRIGVDGKRRGLRSAAAAEVVPDPQDYALRMIAETQEKGDKYQGQRNSNGWLVLKDGSQFLSASHSISCKRYPYASRGKQALTCCVMAVAECAVLDLCRWCVATLNSILDSGDQLYQDSYLHYKPHNTTTLNMEQVLRKFYTPGNCVCRVVVYKPRQRGSLNDDVTAQVHWDWLRQFFREENMGVFVAHGGQFSVAVFKNPRGFYMFDPHDCDRYARAVPAFLVGRARACLSQYPSVKALTENLMSNIASSPNTAVGTEQEGAAESEARRASASRSGTSLSKRTSVVHFDSENAMNQMGQFAIYGMKVTSLRKLKPYEK